MYSQNIGVCWDDRNIGQRSTGAVNFMEGVAECAVTQGTTAPGPRAVLTHASRLAVDFRGDRKQQESPQNDP